MVQTYIFSKYFPISTFWVRRYFPHMYGPPDSVERNVHHTSHPLPLIPHWTWSHWTRPWSPLCCRLCRCTPARPHYLAWSAERSARNIRSHNTSKHETDKLPPPFPSSSPPPCHCHQEDPLRTRAAGQDTYHRGPARWTLVGARQGSWWSPEAQVSLHSSSRRQGLSIYWHCLGEKNFILSILYHSKIFFYHNFIIFQVHPHWAL